MNSCIIKDRVGVFTSSKMEFKPAIYKPQEIEAERWLKREKEDMTNFSKEIPHLMDKRGVIGDMLFDLTLDNQSSNISHRELSVFTGDRVAKGIFQALCPELETFITLINWMGSSSERKTHRVKYFQELKQFIIENRTSEVCKIIGNYRIKNGEFATVILSWADVEISKKEKTFYDWWRVPFIKRSAENFAYFTSPVFMSSAPSNEKNVAEDRVSCFSLLFKIKNIQNNIVRIDIPHCTTPYTKETDVIIYDQKLLDSLSKSMDTYFIGLFEDKIYLKNKYFHREFVLLNISEELDGNDIAAHFITQRLYYNHLKDQQLYLCSKEEFQKRGSLIFYHVRKSYNKEVTMPFEFFRKMYLEAYFVDIGDKIYYKPFIFKNLDKESYAEFMQYLKGKKDNPKEITNLLELMKLHKKYNKHASNLEFLNRYNFYSKRTLIDSIKKWEEKWKV